MKEQPAHILVDILSRLPVKTILHCRCVCKKWRNLLSESYFAKLHLSRSPPSLMIHQMGAVDLPGILKLVETEDDPQHHNFHHDPMMSLDLRLGVAFRNSRLLLVGSVNGLLCMWQFNDEHDNTYICNPITREYMILPRQEYYRKSYAIIVYGFGFCSSTEEYKVIRIFQGDNPPNETSRSRPSLLEGEIYTLGTGRWRSLGHVPFWLAGFHGPFLNGYLHWNVVDEEAPEKICSFDIEKESFQLLPSPPKCGDASIRFQSLGVLGGCLCECHTLGSWESLDSQVFIWVMKEYGIKKSWSKEVLIQTNNQIGLDWLAWEPLYVLQGLKDGSIVMIYYEDIMLTYCPKTKIVEKTEIFDHYFSGMAYVPSFLRLKNFKSENVHVF